MSFEAYETSEESGRPIELYEFYYLGQISRWTSWDRDITIGAFVYTATQLSRSDVTDAGGNISNQNLTLTCNADFPIAELFSVSPPSDVVNVIIKTVQQSDLSDPQVIYPGRILNVSWSNDTCKITCQSILTRLKQPGLRRLYGKMCPHLLYRGGEGECNASEITFRETATLSGVSGITVTAVSIGAQPDGYFDGGKLTAVIGGLTVKRGIRSHVGMTLTLTHRIPGLVPGMTVELLPGCDHTRATCISKFNNEPNFGGFPFVPQKNPFGQNSVF